MRKGERKRLFSLLLSVFLLLFAAGCEGGGAGAADERQASSAGREAAGIYHRIGVSAFSADDPELSMFYGYFQNYIAESFPVEFYISGELHSADDEIAFIEEMKAQDVEGIISFYGLEVERVVDACEENEMYYVLGSASISDEEYEAVKDNPWFLGVIGPDAEEEFQAGRDMAEDFLEQGAQSYLIASGGAGRAANFMHYTRTEGMLIALQEGLGLTYDDTVENLAQTAELTEIGTGRDDVKIVISPGYFQVEEGVSNLRQALEAENFDALLSAVGVSDVRELLENEIRSSEKELLVGVVDCFSRENYEMVQTQDPEGNALLNFVKGKYASMVAPAFAAMFNALEGDVDVVKPDGTAFRLYQSYWTVSDEEEYTELYNYTQNIYENAYSSVDLMSVIRSYSSDADFEQFQTLTEASDMKSVRERLEG